MYIYLIQRDNASYDEYIGFVIVANNKKEVIKLAKNQVSGGYNNYKNIWENATITKEGIYIGKNTEPFILFESFISG